MTPISASPTRFRRNGRLLRARYRSFFLPTVLAAASTSTALIIDSVIVGHLLGPDAMACVNICLPVLQAVMSCSALIGIGASAIIAVAKGENDSDSADMAFTAGIAITVIAGVLLTAAGLPLAGALSAALASPGLYDGVKAYMEILLGGSLPALAVPVAAYLLRTDSMVRTASLMLILSNLLNILLDLLFIIPCGMGIRGSALATVTSYLLSLGVMAAYFRSPGRTLRWKGVASLAAARSRRLIRRILTTGMPGALSTMLLSLKLFLLNVIIGRYAGSDGLVIFSVCLQCMSLAAIFINGAAITMLPVIGVTIGERDYRGTSLSVSYALGVCTIATAAIAALIMAFTPSVFAIFDITGQQILLPGIPAVRVFALGLIGMGANFVLVYFFTATGRTTLASALSLIEGLLIIVPLAWALIATSGFEAMWWAFPIAELLSTATIIMMAKASRRHDPRGMNMLLIPRHSDDQIIDMTATATPDAITGISREITATLTRAGESAGTANHAAVAIEEMLNHATEGISGNVTADIRATILPDSVRISLRHNGNRREITRYSSPEPDPERAASTPGLLSILSVAMTQSRAIELNNLTVDITRQPPTS